MSVSPVPAYQATHANAFIDYVRSQANPMPSLSERRGLKREREEAGEEAREQVREQVSEHERDPAQPAQSPPPRVPGKKAKAAVPVPVPVIEQERELERESEAPPPLELGPPAPLPDSKSSPDIDTKAARARSLQAARDALNVPSLVRLSGPAREEALAQRRAVLDAWAQDQGLTERPVVFARLGHQLSLSTPATPEEVAAFDLSLLAAGALARHMTPGQRQGALRVATAVPGAPHALKADKGLQRRIQLISLYENMDADAREAQLAVCRRDADLIDMDHASMKKAIKVRADQFSALGYLMTPAQRQAELARLRQLGRLLHMDATARVTALELLAAQFWGAMTALSSSELREEQALAVAITQGLQEMAETPWQRTLELRQTELAQSCRLTPIAVMLPSLREAVVPTALADLRGPALERGLALRKVLVREMMARLPPQDRDRALADARAPATLADCSAMALEIAIRLRKLVFEEYFRTLPPTGAAATAARVELASALDTSGLASQPEAQALRSALLRLALVEAADPNSVVETFSSSSSSSASVQWR